ncbi:MAG: hypothetical protein IPK76_03535 [Lewinellaceae bacterium]|nr:hypothetical protein [Lewinellaceae bacterium]
MPPAKAKAMLQKNARTRTKWPSPTVRLPTTVTGAKAKNKAAPQLPAIPLKKPGAHFFVAACFFDGFAVLGVKVLRYVILFFQTCKKQNAISPNFSFFKIEFFFTKKILLNIQTPAPLQT